MRLERTTKMAEIELNIIEFVTRLKLVEPGGLILGHRGIPKAFYGLELDADELEFLLSCHRAQELCPARAREIDGIIGRRGGKTRLAALIAVYEATRDHGLPRGERAFILIIAPVLDQAQIAFDYVSKYMNGSPELLKLVVKERQSEIELRNGITIACRPCLKLQFVGTQSFAQFATSWGSGCTKKPPPTPSGKSSRHCGQQWLR